MDSITKYFFYNKLESQESRKAGKPESTKKNQQLLATLHSQDSIIYIIIRVQVILYTRASFYVILTTIEVYIHKENNTISSIHVKNTINNNSINVNDGTNNH